jgi:hypothetical protein
MTEIPRVEMPNNLQQFVPFVCVAQLELAVFSFLFFFGKASFLPGSIVPQGLFFRRTLGERSTVFSRDLLSI